MVSDLLSSTEGRGDISTASLATYTEKFNALFPLYLSFGMTEEQYWDKDCCLTVYYRKSEEIRTNRKNHEMWLQGAYFYDALCRVSPVMRAFAKKGTKPLPYPAEPYAITNKQAEFEEHQHEKKIYDKGKVLMTGFMVQNNKKFERK